MRTTFCYFQTSTDKDDVVTLWGLTAEGVGCESQLSYCLCLSPLTVWRFPGYPHSRNMQLRWIGTKEKLQVESHVNRLFNLSPNLSKNKIHNDLNKMLISFVVINAVSSVGRALLPWLSDRGHDIITQDLFPVPVAQWLWLLIYMYVSPGLSPNNLV